MSEIYFESSLTIEEIDRNFEDVNLFSGIMEGLNEALAYEKDKTFREALTSPPKNN